MKEPLFGKTLAQLRALAQELDAPAFVATQLARWLYKQGASDFDAMHNLPKRLRQILGERVEIGRREPERVSLSSDGTKKYLYPTAHARFIETAFIPEGERATLCLSTQVGCKMGCLFCMTGKQGFQGNLSAGEIVSQYRSLPEHGQVTNIVYMGMGEPLDNLEAVLSSLEILTSEWGFSLSPRRITVSTVGIIPAMRDFLKRSESHLAISLHSPFDEERRRLMPVQNVYPLPEVLAALRESPIARRRRISFEYIMFDGLNDTPRHAKELVRILSGLRCRVNLIRFHPIPGTPLASSSEESMVRFEQQLKASGIMTTIRASRGEDIMAACGLLSTKALVGTGREVDY